MPISTSISPIGLELCSNNVESAFGVRSILGALFLIFFLLFKFVSATCAVFHIFHYLILKFNLKIF